MKFNYILSVLFILALQPATNCLAQAPPILWQKTIGGNDDDILSGVDPLSGGGALMSGFSKSGISGDKKDSSRGGFDYWLVKLDINGKIAFEKTYGGVFDDTSTRVIKTADNGILLAGTSVSPRSGDKIYENWGG